MLQTWHAVGNGSVTDRRHSSEGRFSQNPVRGKYDEDASHKLGIRISRSLASVSSRFMRSVQFMIRTVSRLKQHFSYFEKETQPGGVP